MSTGNQTENAAGLGNQISPDQASLRVQTVSVSTEGPRTTHCLAPLFCPLTADSGTFLGQKHTLKRCGSVVEITKVCAKRPRSTTFTPPPLESHKTADVVRNFAYQ